MEGNYFAFYGIEPAFFPDEKRIKQKYYEFSKQYHPDFYTGEDDSKQAEMLALSSLNNKAYTTLSNKNKRIAYILSLFFPSGETMEKIMDTEFLMEMMDWNEKLAEAQMDHDEKALAGFSQDCDQMIQDMENTILPDMEAFDKGQREPEILERIRDYYFKQKYLLRVQENISNFARL